MFRLQVLPTRSLTPDQQIYVEHPAITGVQNSIQSCALNSAFPAHPLHEMRDFQSTEDNLWISYSAFSYVNCPQLFIIHLLHTHMQTSSNHAVPLSLCVSSSPSFLSMHKLALVRALTFTVMLAWYQG